MVAHNKSCQITKSQIRVFFISRDGHITHQPVREPQIAGSCFHVPHCLVLLHPNNQGVHPTSQRIKNQGNSLRRGPTGPSSLAPATQDKMHPFIIIQ